MKIEMIVYREEKTIESLDVQRILFGRNEFKLDHNKIKYKDHQIRYTTRHTKDSDYVRIILIMDATNKQTISLFTEFKTLIQNILRNQGYLVTAVYDDTIHYYNQQLYPLLAKHEMLVRQLIYIVLIKIFRGKWIEKTMNTRNKRMYENALDRVKFTLNENEKHIERVLEAFQYSDYVKILFNPTKKDKTKKSTLWNDFFYDVDFPDAQKVLQENITVRNSVMHMKQISESQFKKNKADILKINKTLDTAISHVNDIHIPKNKHEIYIESLEASLPALSPEAKESIGALVNSYKHLSKIIQEPMFQQATNMISRINFQPTTAASKHINTLPNPLLYSEHFKNIQLNLDAIQKLFPKKKLENKNPPIL